MVFYSNSEQKLLTWLCSFFSQKHKYLQALSCHGIFIDTTSLIYMYIQYPSRDSHVPQLTHCQITYLTPFRWPSEGRSSSGRTVGYCSVQSACRCREHRGAGGGDPRPDEWTCTATPVNVIHHWYTCIFPTLHRSIHIHLHIAFSWTYINFLKVWLWNSFFIHNYLVLQMIWV